MFIVMNQCFMLSHLSIIKRFLNVRDDVHNDPKSGENMERVLNCMRSDRRLTIRIMAEALSMTKESIRKF
jgi:hypothetical protein